jgi:hypothetical protein
MADSQGDNITPPTAADMIAWQEKTAKEKASKKAKRGGKGWINSGEAVVELPRDIVRPKDAGQPSARMPIAHGRVFGQNNEDQ